MIDIMVNEHHIEFRLGPVESDDDDGNGGWRNGEIRIDGGSRIGAGGCWVGADDSTTVYERNDAGHVTEVATALGISDDDAVELLQELTATEAH